MLFLTKQRYHTPGLHFTTYYWIFNRYLNLYDIIFPPISACLKNETDKMTDANIEKEIQEKGLLAPRITPDHLETVITSEQYHVFANTTFTACLLTLKNGYTVLGESACASPENFNAALGR